MYNKHDKAVNLGKHLHRYILQTNKKDLDIFIVHYC